MDDFDMRDSRLSLGGSLDLATPFVVLPVVDVPDKEAILVLVLAAEEELLLDERDGEFDVGGAPIRECDKAS